MVHFKIKELADCDFDQVLQSFSFEVSGEQMEIELPAYGYSWWQTISQMLLIMLLRIKF